MRMKRIHCKCLRGFTGYLHFMHVKMTGKHYRRQTSLWYRVFFPAISMEKSSMNHKETPYLQLFPCKKYCISLCTEFLYYVYKCSLQRLWGLPATFTIFPINIEDFPLCNTGTPQNFHNVYRVFSYNIYGKKQYESQGNPILMGFLFNSYCFFP